MTALEKYLYQLRRIEQHREAKAEKEIRKIYKQILKELNSYLANIYLEYSEDDMLTYGDLARVSMDARFLEEVEQRISGISPQVAKQIEETVQQTYEACYDGMVHAVNKAAGNRELLKKAFETLGTVSPDVIRAAVNNPISGLTLKDTLEKHRKEIIYDIKKNIGIGLTNGDRYTTMAKRIAESLDGDYKKAVRIVRTETHRVRESGFNDAASDVNNALKNGKSGYVMAKTWKTMQDERVRPKKQKRKTYNHVKMDGVTIPQDELFKLPSGATCMCPSQTGVAGEDINCRCYVSYDLVLASELTKVQDGTKTIEEAAQVETTEGISNKDIDKAQTIQELNDKMSYAIKEDGTIDGYIKFNYDENMNLDVAKEQVKHFVKLKEEYHTDTIYEVASKKGSIGTDGVFTRIGNDTGGILYVNNKKKYMSVEDYKKRLERNFRGRAGFDGTTLVNPENANISTFYHEFGHAFGVYTQRKIAGKEDFWKEIMTIKKEYSKKAKGMDIISDYANESVDEFLAEAFTQAKLYNEPSIYALRVLEVIDKYFKK
jgi:hypothetical protein